MLRLGQADGVTVWRLTNRLASGAYSPCDAAWMLGCASSITYGEGR